MGRRQNKRARRNERKTGVVLLVAAAGLAGALLCLLLVGRPPVILDELWVWRHLAAVRLFFLSVLIASFASVALVAARRRRAPLAGCWVVAGAVTAAYLLDRLFVVCQVAFDYYLR